MPDLTLSQREAIEYRAQDACVVAGPGSGKTTVLVERYRALVEDHRFEPREILAITFTEKAAANMKAKLARQFEHNPGRVRDLEAAWVSTIHGFCARLLRENAIAAGIDPRFLVLDAREAEELQYECLNAALDEFVDKRRPDALALIETLHSPHVTHDLRNAYDGIRSAGLTIAEVRAMPAPNVSVDPRQMARRLRDMLAGWPTVLTEARQKQQADLREWAERLATDTQTDLKASLRLIKDCPLHMGKVPKEEKPALEEFREDLGKKLAPWIVDRSSAPYRAMIMDVLARFDDLYNERKAVVWSLDFNDLERRTIELLRGNPAVRTRIQTQFRQVMLDEFQDVNEQQDELIGLVRGENVFFGVGDINQSIYGFRHARPSIFKDYRDRVAAAEQHLTYLGDNFRSRAEILLCVEALLGAAKGIEQRDLVAGGTFHHKPEPSIEILRITAADRDEGAALEARWIAHRILALRGTLRIAGDGTADFRDFAVLCRSSESMKPVLEAFENLRIPYVCGRRQSYLVSREGLDIAALLESIANPRDGIGLATLLRSPLVGISDDGLLRLRLAATSLEGGLNLLAHNTALLADFEPADRAKLQRFIPNLRRWREEQAVLSLDHLIARALADCGFEWTPDTLAGDNVESFLHLARTRGNGRSLVQVLHDIESLKRAVSVEAELSDEDQGNCVQVMTAHAAKGLEFPVTIIAAMDKGTQQSVPPITFSPQAGLGLKWNDPFGKNKLGSDGGTTGGLKDSWQVANSDIFKARDVEESNRLLYVAMTRAEEHLILSYSRGERRPKNWAELLEQSFRLDSVDLSEAPETLAVTNTKGETFELEVRTTDTEPPPPESPARWADEADELVTVPRPAVTDQHDTAVNVTSLTVFANCPRKYYIQRYIGWNTGRFTTFDPEDLPNDAPETSAAELGTMVHEILSQKATPEKTLAWTPEARQLADVFFRNDLGLRAAKAERAAREWDFIVDIDGTLVRGSIDLWFVHGGSLEIADYKTDDIPAADVGKRAAEYAPQLALYALALERAFGRRPARASLHFLRPNKVVEVPLDDAAISHVRDLIARLRDAQAFLRFELNEGPHCRSCQFYRAQCPAGQNAPAA